MGCGFQECDCATRDSILTPWIGRRLLFKNCFLSDSHVGPGILEDVVIDTLRVNDTLWVWSPCLRRVKFSGKIGRVLINRNVSLLTKDTQVQEELDRRRREFYLSNEWALDISEARFNDLDISGIPASRIIVDPARHGTISRESTTQTGWRDRIRSTNTYLVDLIDGFLQDGEDDRVIVIPDGCSRSERKELLDSLAELRDLGVVY